MVHVQAKGGRPGDGVRSPTGEKGHEEEDEEVSGGAVNPHVYMCIRMRGGAVLARVSVHEEAISTIRVIE